MYNLDSDEFGRRAGKKRHSHTPPPPSAQNTNNDAYVQKWKYKVSDEEEERKQKKEVSNAVKKEKERERRGRMTDSIEVLRSLIPQCKDKKINQSRVMELAVYHIQALEQRNEEQARYISELEAQLPQRPTKRLKVSNDSSADRRPEMSSPLVSSMKVEESVPMTPANPTGTSFSTGLATTPNSEGDWTPTFPPPTFDDPFMPIGSTTGFEDESAMNIFDTENIDIEDIAAYKWPFQPFGSVPAMSFAPAPQVAWGPQQPTQQDALHQQQLQSQKAPQVQQQQQAQKMPTQSQTQLNPAQYTPLQTQPVVTQYTPPPAMWATNTGVHVPQKAPQKQPQEQPQKRPPMKQPPIPQPQNSIPAQPQVQQQVQMHSPQPQKSVPTQTVFPQHFTSNQTNVMMIPQQPVAPTQPAPYYYQPLAQAQQPAQPMHPVQPTQPIQSTQPQPHLATSTFNQDVDSHLRGQFGHLQLQYSSGFLQPQIANQNSNVQPITMQTQPPNAQAWGPQAQEQIIQPQLQAQIQPLAQPHRHTDHHTRAHIPLSYDGEFNPFNNEFFSADF